MIDEERDFLDQLLNRALNEPNTEFELLTNYDSYLGGKQVKKVLRGLIRLLKVADKQLKKDLKHLLKVGVTKKQFDDYKNSINLVTLCINYYKVELDVAKSQVQEFRVYMRSGNFLKMFLGEERPEEDMVDYRTLPVSFF